MGVGRPDESFRFGEEAVEESLEFAAELRDPPRGQIVLPGGVRRRHALCEIECHPSLTVIQRGEEGGNVNPQRATAAGTEKHRLKVIAGRTEKIHRPPTVALAVYGPQKGGVTSPLMAFLLTVVQNPSPCQFASRPPYLSAPPP